MFAYLNHFHDLILLGRDIPAFALFPLTALLVYQHPRSMTLIKGPIMPAAAVIGLLVIATTIWVSTVYLFAPGYLDWVEPSIVAVSYWYWHGHPLYPDWTEGQGFYGWVYGPLLFQINAWALSLSATILMSKLPGFCSFWIACAVTAFSLRPLLRPGYWVLLPMTVCIAMSGSFWDWTYYNRSEPYLILCVALALLSLRLSNHTFAAIAIGALSGIAISLKIHGFLYIVPFAVALLAGKAFTQRFRLAAIGTLASLPFIVLPFMSAQVTTSGYIGFLSMTAGHGLRIVGLSACLILGGVLLTPVLLLSSRYRDGDKQTDMPFGISYFVCVLIVCVIAAKPGAGQHHLLPFLPAFAYLFVRMWQFKVGSVVVTRTTDMAVCCVVLCIAYAPAFLISFGDIREICAELDRNQSAIPEVKAIYAAYPGAVMGVAGTKTFRLTDNRIVGSFEGAAPTAEFVAIWDFQASGMSEAPVERLFEDCRTPFWIMPKGEDPFTLPNFYWGRPMFTDAFRASFNAHYEIVESDAYYVVWGCRDHH